MKECTVCKKLLAIDKFYKKKNGKFSVAAICKECYDKKQKQWLQTSQGIASRKKAMNKSCQTHRELLYNLKINGCAICGYNDCNNALEFHHINPENKKFNIGLSTIGRKELFDEFNKCILLCANCHKEIHCKMRGF